MRHATLAILLELVAGLGAFLAAEAPAHAAPRWVDRGITLPRFGFSFDAGLGIAHYSAPNPGPCCSLTGPGMNLEGAFGITSNLEIGLRTGFRFGDDARLLQADSYGRLFDTETYGTGHDVVANPEFHIRGRIINAHLFELGLEGRVYLPIESGTYIGMMFGVPMALHLGDIFRLDLGAYVPVIFYHDPPGPQSLVSFPARFWIQPTDRLWLGPMAAIRYSSYQEYQLLPYARPKDFDLLVGFGLGYQFAKFADFKTDFIFPQINQEAGARLFGAGVGIGLIFD